MVKMKERPQLDPVELMSKIKGIVNFLVTPFDTDDWRKLDPDGLKKNVRFLNDGGIDVLVPCGGMGEITQLTIEEHKKVIEVVVEEARESLVVPVVGPATKQAIQLAKYAEDIGAAGVIVFPPPWIPYSEEGLYRHVRAVADSVKVGIVVTKFPESNLSAPLIDKLAGLRNIVGVKFEPGGDELEIFNNMIREVGRKLAWLVNTHHTGQLAPYFHMAGVEAFMDAIPNFAPKYDHDMWIALAQKNYKLSTEIQLRLSGLAKLMKDVGSITLVKEAMNMVGLAGGSFRPPTIPATSVQREQIQQAMRELDLV